MAWYDGTGSEPTPPAFSRGDLVTIIAMAARGHVIAISRTGLAMPRRYAVETIEGELHFCTADELRPGGRAANARGPRLVCVDGIRIDK